MAGGETREVTEPITINSLSKLRGFHCCNQKFFTTMRAPPVHGIATCVFRLHMRWLPFCPGCPCVAGSHISTQVNRSIFSPFAVKEVENCLLVSACPISDRVSWTSSESQNPHGWRAPPTGGYRESNKAMEVQTVVGTLVWCHRPGLLKTHGEAELKVSLFWCKHIVQTMHLHDAHYPWTVWRLPCINVSYIVISFDRRKHFKPLFLVSNLSYLSFLCMSGEECTAKVSKWQTPSPTSG